MVVGEAPGRFEDEQGRPFVGRAGQLLDELLAEAGLARDEVFITNVVKARPPGNRDPTKAEVAHWMPVLEAQLALVAPRLIVPLGRHALAHFAPAAKIGEAHGRAVTERGRELFPLYHPAAALRSTKLRETLFADARALPESLARLRRGPVAANRGPWRSWRSHRGREPRPNGLPRPPLPAALGRRRRGPARARRRLRGHAARG